MIKVESNLHDIHIAFSNTILVSQVFHSRGKSCRDVIQMTFLMFLINSLRRTGREWKRFLNETVVPTWENGQSCDIDDIPSSINGQSCDKKHCTSYTHLPGTMGLGYDVALTVIFQFSAHRLGLMASGNCQITTSKHKHEMHIIINLSHQRLYNLPQCTKRAQCFTTETKRIHTHFQV